MKSRCRGDEAVMGRGSRVYISHVYTCCTHDALQPNIFSINSVPGRNIYRKIMNGL